MVVGAGIGGLSAAISLRAHGKDVTVLEASGLKKEVGAGISVPPNSTRILRAWGFDAVRAQASEPKVAREFNEQGELVDEVDLEAVVDKAQSPWWMLHRQDLHAELKRLACGERKLGGWGKPVVIREACRVVSVSIEDTQLVLESGERISASFIIAADGVHSIVRQEILRRMHQSDPSVYSGHSAFRTLVPVAEALKNPRTAPYAQGIMECHVGKDGRRLLLFSCRDGKFVNLFGPTPWPVSQSEESWQAKATFEELQHAFSAFPPSLLEFLRLGGEFGFWQIRDREPIQTWHINKTVLVGDACHPMLPHQGQGAAQAVEDAAVLPIFLYQGPPKLSLHRRLCEFEKFRYPRAKAMQDRSRLQKEAPRMVPGKSLPTISQFSGRVGQVQYDVLEEARKAIDNCCV